MELDGQSRHEVGVARRHHRILASTQIYAIGQHACEAAGAALTCSRSCRPPAAGQRTAAGCRVRQRSWPGHCRPRVRRPSARRQTSAEQWKRRDGVIGHWHGATIKTWWQSRQRGSWKTSVMYRSPPTCTYGRKSHSVSLGGPWGAPPAACTWPPPATLARNPPCAAGCAAVIARAWMDGAGGKRPWPEAMCWLTREISSMRACHRGICEKAALAVHPSSSMSRRDMWRRLDTRAPC